MEVLQARAEHLTAVAKLFDQYRVFYHAASDYAAAQQFIAARLQHQDSVIFIACLDTKIVGFTQLYPSFSSVSMQQIWILNDLFVDPQHRGEGVAKALLNVAQDFAERTGAIRIVLATQISNIPAQALYAAAGYLKDEAFYHYALPLSGVVSSKADR
jgi:GNAT superfamily N-acetyltransferase